MIPQKILIFTKELRENNSRVWFQANKEKYNDALIEAKSLKDSILDELNKIDVIEKAKIYRIYRDVRFSKDKTPYNSNFRFSFSRAGTKRRGGYFFKVGHVDTYVACGFWNPGPADLKLIRSHISAEPQILRKILASKNLINTFGQLEGTEVKTSPKGFCKDDPAIDLIRKKQFIVSKAFSNKEVLSKDFLPNIIMAYKAIRPFFDYMTDILTHDLNGESLINEE